MTLALVAANVLLFWYELALGSRLDPFLERWGLVPLEVADAALGHPDSAGALVTPLSAMFLHTSWLHLLRNLVYLGFFGRLVEAELGPTRLLAVYLLAGLTAALAQVVATPQSAVPAIGASGAVAGLLGAYLFLRHRGHAGPSFGGGELAARLLLMLWLVVLALGGFLELARPELGPGPVSWWGHLAGLIAGAILVSLDRSVRFAMPAARRGG